MAGQRSSEQIIVVTGGDPVDAAQLADLPEQAMVIAADSGIDHALAVGLHVDVAVGDFDSVSPAGLQRVSDAGAEVERHPGAKDETDLELALDAAVRRGARCVHVLGGHGGRLDHFMANALLLAAPAYASLTLVAQMGSARVTVVRGETLLQGCPADLVTLLAVGGPAGGVTTTGLRYPLTGDDLQPGSTRGVSNRFTTTQARVTLLSGTVLAVQPDHIGTNSQRTHP